MKINITIDTNDMARGKVGFDEGKTLRSQKSNPMVPTKMDSKYEIGFDAGIEDDSWTGRFIEYTVKEGDTVESIAKAHGVKPADISLLNQKEGNMGSDKVNVGQTIKVPEMDKED